MWHSKPFVIFFSVVAAVSVMLLFRAWRIVALYDHFLQTGIETRGAIIDYDVRTGHKGYGQNHYYTYRFLDSGALPYENQVIRNEPDSRFEVGRDIKIIYDPLDPNSNIPSIMVPEDIYQPIYAALKFMVAALGATFAFCAFVFSKFAQSRLSWASLKRLWSITQR